MVINGGLSNVWKNRADPRDDWWSGAPSWFLGDRRLRLFMEALWVQQIRHISAFQTMDPKGIIGTI
jgi:hypothetical protein